MYTILIVDDNASNLFTLRTLLESSMEVDVLEAQNGSDALDVISRHPEQIDLIMLDVQMPGMNGFEVAHLLRSRKKYSSIPIIFLTAVYTTDDFKYEGLKQGAIDYLTKPIDDTILLNRIKAHLRLLENERILNRQLHELNAQLQQEIEERRRIEVELREAKDAALHSKDQALEAQREALEARQAEQDARLLAEEAQTAAEAANRAKSDFLRNMSHELRTPLNGILGYAQILQKDPQLHGTQRENIDTIRRSGEHLLTLLNDVLDLSNIDTGQLQLEPCAFHLPALLNSLLDMARILAHAKSLSVEYHAPESMPEVVYGDKRRLRQVLLHLFSNANKFTRQGSITLDVTLVEDTVEHSSGVTLQFSVSDTGIGIREDDMEHIFLPFERLSNPQLYVEGAGLGLALSQRLLHMMGSRLQTESQPGHGSRFWFTMTFPETSIPPSEDNLSESASTGIVEEHAHNVITPPPTDVVRSLLELADVGDVGEMLNALERLEQQDEVFLPFIENIRTLARGFHISQLRQFIRTYSGGQQDGYNSVNVERYVSP